MNNIKLILPKESPKNKFILGKIYVITSQTHTNIGIIDDREKAIMVLYLKPFGTIDMSFNKFSIYASQFL